MLVSTSCSYGLNLKAIGCYTLEAHEAWGEGDSAGAGGGGGARGAVCKRILHCRIVWITKSKENNRRPITRNGAEQRSPTYNIGRGMQKTAYEATAVSLKGNFYFSSLKRCQLEKTLQFLWAAYSQRKINYLRVWWIVHQTFLQQGCCLDSESLARSRRGAGPFLNDLVFSHLLRGPKVGNWGWLPVCVCVGGSFNPNGKNRHAKTEVMSRRRLQEEPEPVSFSEANPLPKGGLLPRASKKPQILPWIPVSHLMDSSAPRPLQPQLFPIAKSWGLLESVGWGLPNKKASECSIQPQRNVSKPTSEQPFYPHLLPPHHFLSLTPNTNLHTLTQPHTWWKWVKGMSPNLWKQISDGKKLHLFKSKEIISVYKITNRIGGRQTRTITNLRLISGWGRGNITQCFSLVCQIRVQVSTLLLTCLTLDPSYNLSEPQFSYL